MTKIISIEEYHRLKSYHPMTTISEQRTRVPHVCESNDWKTSPHCGKQCWECVEVLKIIKYEDRMEEKYKDRQYTLYSCRCHQCRNHLRLAHDDCKTCNPCEPIVIDLTGSDEEEIIKEEIIEPTIDKEKARNNNNNSSPQDWSETSYNNHYFPYDWSQSESKNNNNNTSIPWSQNSSKNSNTASIS